MKTLASFNQTVGGDGAVASGAVGVKGSNIRAEVAVEYPIEKVVEPATKALDSALDKLEKLIPGDWDKPLIEKVKTEYKQELVKLLSE